jgi:hypothetical protein
MSPASVLFSCASRTDSVMGGSLQEDARRTRRARVQPRRPTPLVTLGGHSPTLAQGAARSSEPKLHAWRDSEAIGDGSVTGFGSPSPAECSSPLQFWSALPELWSHGLTATVRAAPPWWCSHSCWSAWSPWMPSAGESSLLFAVSSWTVGSGVIPEHSRNRGR